MLFSDIAITLLALNLSFMKPQISISYIHWELCSCPLQRWVCTCLVKRHQSLMSSQIEQFFFSSWWPKIYVTGLRNIRTIKVTLSPPPRIFFKAMELHVHVSVKKKIIYINMRFWRLCIILIFGCKWYPVTDKVRETNATWSEICRLLPAYKLNSPWWDKYRNWR